MKRESSSPDFVGMEEDILKFWQENKCFEKLVDKNKNGKRFKFLDGPITANNEMGIHHAWNRTLKDVYLKHRAMNGFSAEYRNGFDAHGLPVELAVERELGINSKREILDYGMDKFVKKCLERVEKYSAIQTEQSKRLGQWMDWNNSYYTNTDENITAIWYFLKKCDEHGWLVKNNRPMMWCPRCGTSLSDHEMHGSYKDIEHTALFIKLPLLNDSRKILVWTTTPWTLSANVAIAVNPNNRYLEVIVKSDSSPLIIGKEALKVLKDDVLEVKREFDGAELVGKEYETCFNELSEQSFAHRIVPWEDVSASEGSGAVHIAPGCGVEDFELGSKLGLPEISPIDENGVILSGFGVLAGYKTGEVKDIVFDELKKRNKLYYTHKFKHSYPICWRCKQEIVFRLVGGWFIKVDEIRPRLLKAIENVKWDPVYLQKRMEDWLENMGDWNISRSRFYGLPLPIYPCQCGHKTVVGSLEELKNLSSVEEVEALPHLHRPYIDKVEINCPKCGSKVKRVTEVGDCWLDAGITPYSTKKYFTDREYWKENFPNDVVIEMREQIRLWFYSILFMSVVLEDKTPFVKVVGHESVVQEDGSKFSKSGFMVKLNEFADKLGTDTARYIYSGNPLTSQVRFGFNMGDEARRKLLGYWNAYTFFTTYACIDKPDLKGYRPEVKDFDNTDKWLIQLTNDFVKNSQKNYEDFKSYNVVSDFEKMIGELTNFYIRANRRRFWRSENNADKQTAYWCLYNCLKAITKVMAPIIPFMTEYIWQNMVRDLEGDEEESVLLSGFAGEIFAEDFSEYLEYTQIAQKVITLASRLRNENQLKVKQPLSKAFVVSDNPHTLLSVKQYEDLIKDELNIKEVEVTDGVEKFNTYYLTINFKLAGGALKGDVPRLKQTLENATESQMAEMVAGFNSGRIEIDGFGELDSSLFIKNSKPKEEFVLSKEDDLTVVLDIVLTEELIKEGILREIIRNAQILRKEADFDIDARVMLDITSKSEKISGILQANAEKIKQEVLAVNFNQSAFQPDIEREIELDDGKVNFRLKTL